MANQMISLITSSTTDLHVLHITTKTKL